MSVYTFVIKDGDRLAVLRPKNPERAVHDTQVVQAKAKSGKYTPDEIAAEFDAILRSQPYTFVGILGEGPTPSERGVILDASRRVIGRVKLGDSFVRYSQLAEALGVKEG